MYGSVSKENTPRRGHRVAEKIWASIPVAMQDPQLLQTLSSGQELATSRPKWPSHQLLPPQPR